MAGLAVRCWKDEEDLFVSVALARRTFVRVHAADKRSVTAGIPIAYGRLVANAKQSTRNWRTVTRHERRATASATEHLQNGQVNLRMLEENAGGQREAFAEQESDRLCEWLTRDDVLGRNDPVGLQERKAGPGAARRPDRTKGELVPRDVLVGRHVR